jgi:hypothetical protein
MRLASGEEERSPHSRGRGAGEQLIHLIPEADHLIPEAHLTPTRSAAQTFSSSSSWYTNAVGIHPLIAHVPHHARSHALAATGVGMCRVWRRCQTLT